MVSFLIDRPIAVLSAVFALIVVGLVSTLRLPVSLMPDVEIPEITVQVKGQNQSARELEDALVAPLRRELLQVPELKEIESQTRANVGLIKLRLKHGTSVDYTFLEVNEQIDAAMSNLPRNIERPNVIKASTTDLPVFYINMGIKAPKDSNISKQQFLELSEFAENVIRKRLEQLPEIALVDLTGRQFSEVQIQPDLNRMQSLRITQEQLGQILEENNINLGSLLVRDGKYQFNIRLSSKLQTAQDIANIYIKSGDKLFQIKDFASVTIAAQERTGAYLSQGRVAIGMAIIKQADARMSTLKEKVAEQIRLFERDYPEISFNLSQDQTLLLDYSLDNLVQSLIWGSIFAFIMLFIFLKDPRAPWLIGLTIPLSVMISLSAFYVFNISINIISLSGLVLGVGLMIDNAIIVIDNIIQKLSTGISVREACIKGTVEVIRPLLSSAMTTSAVFLPLIFLSGISGALFFDQALTVSIGLGSSLLVSITALPTLFKLLYSKKRRLSSSKKPSFFVRGYESLMDLIWRYPSILGLSILGICISGIYMGSKIKIQKLPKLTQSELILELDWNEPLNISAHVSLVKKLLDDLSPYYLHDDAQVGTQQFVLNNQREKSFSELSLYLKAENAQKLSVLKDTLKQWISAKYPNLPYEIQAPKNILERLFPDNEAPLQVKISERGKQSMPEWVSLETFFADMKAKNGNSFSAIPSIKYQMVQADLEKLALYQIPVPRLYQELQTAFRASEIGKLQNQRKEIPVVLVGNVSDTHSILAKTMVANKEGILIPISSLVSVSQHLDYQTLYGGKNGTFVPLTLEVDREELPNYLNTFESLNSKHKNLHIEFGGALFSGNEQVKELMWIMLVALVMLYFILAAQFESLLQPLIILVEIPIDLCAALIFLYLGGSSLNIMAMIGMIVMSGIIINDSILKIDTINRLRKEGLGLKSAIQEAGKRRLTPIIMTSLTTILAVLPFLFGEGLGTDLQKPLALALIGGMGIGTLVSIYFIPLAYNYLYQNNYKIEST